MSSQNDEALPLKCIYFNPTLKSYCLITKGVLGSIALLDFKHAMVSKYNREHGATKDIRQIMKHKSIDGWN